MNPEKYLVSPANWKSVIDLISSEIMHESVKMSALYHLRDEVYRDRKVCFHLDMNNGIELKGINRSNIPSESANENTTFNE